MTEPKHRGVVRVDLELLAEALHLPDGHTIANARMGDSFAVLELLVEGPTLPATVPGQVTPWVRFVLTQQDDAGAMVPKRTITGRFET